MRKSSRLSDHKPVNSYQSSLINCLESFRDSRSAILTEGHFHNCHMQSWQRANSLITMKDEINGRVSMPAIRKPDMLKRMYYRKSTSIIRRWWTENSAPWEGTELFKRFLKPVSFFAVAAAILIGCSNADRPKEELLKEGIRLLEQKNPRGAVVLLKNALDKDPNYFEARFQLAKAYYNLGNFDSAEKETQKVIRQNPSLKDAHIELAKISLQKSKPEDALKEIAPYAGEDSNDAEAIEVAGWAYAIKGDYNPAIRLLKKAADLGTKDNSAGVSLAKVYMKTGNLKEAKARVQEILTKEPANLGAIYTSAEVDIASGDADSAIKAYDSILKDHGSEFEALFRKGVLYIEKKRYDEALSVSAKLIESFPKRPEGYKLKGFSLLYKKDLNESIVSLQKALSIGQDPGTFYFLGLAHFYKGELEQSMSQLQKSLDMDPGLPHPRILLSFILMRQNRVEEAVTEIKKAVEKNPTLAFAHNVLGNAYMATGKYEEGLSELNKALQLDPGMVDAYIKKGTFNMGRGNYPEAELNLKTAVETAPDILNPRITLAAYYIKRKELGKAFDVLKKGVNGGKSDAVLFNMMAEVLLQENKVDDAVSYLEKAKKADPDFYNPYFDLSAVYFLTGKPDKGVAELKSVIERSPENIKALLAASSFYETRGDQKEALKYLEQAVTTGKAEAFIARAVYHVKRNETNEAIKYLDKAIDKEPSNIPAQELKGSVLISAGRHKEAISVFEGIERINPRVGLSSLVKAYLVMKRPEDALESVKKELKKDPENADLLAEVSRIYSLMGKKDEAAANAREMIRLKPDSAAGHIVLATVYKQNKETDKAIESLKDAQKLDKKDANIHMLLGVVYASRKDYRAALDEFGKAEELSPRNPQPIFEHGVVLNLMGNKKEAAGEYIRVLRLSSNHVPALNNLACIYAEDSRDIDKAMQVAARAYILAPGDGAVLDTFGLVLTKKGRVDEGLKLLQKADKTMPGNPSIIYHLALAYKEKGETALAAENLEKALGLGEFPEDGKARAMLSGLKADNSRKMK